MSAPRINQGLFRLIVMTCLVSAGAWGHPGLDEELARVSALIENSPTNAALLLQRAELHRRHSDFARALADIAVAARLTGGAPAVALARARVFGDAGETRAALTAVEDFLAAEPGHPDALVLRARCLTRLQRAGEAVADYTAALQHLARPSPDLFLERARTQAALGRLDEAVAGLDEGRARLGELVSLQLAAIEYERQGAKFDAALGRVDQLLARNRAKETWLALRAEILEQSGRLDAARQVYRQALEAVAGYSAARRGLEMTSQLEQRLRAGLARTERRLALAAHTTQRHDP
jgi:tetratricopeptide (TPR) repeat protein